MYSMYRDEHFLGNFENSIDKILNLYWIYIADVQGVCPRQRFESGAKNSYK